MAYRSSRPFPHIADPSKTSYCTVDPKEVDKGMRPPCQIHVHTKTTSNSTIANIAALITDAESDDIGDTVTLDDYNDALKEKEDDFILETRKRQYEEVRRMSYKTREEQYAMGAAPSAARVKYLIEDGETTEPYQQQEILDNFQKMLYVVRTSTNNLTGMFSIANVKRAIELEEKLQSLEDVDREKEAILELSEGMLTDIHGSNEGQSYMAELIREIRR